MALRIKGSYGLALLVTAALTGWMATGDVVLSGQSDENGPPPPAERSDQVAVKAVRVAVDNFSAKPRAATLTVRGRTEADSKVIVRSETAAIVRNRPVGKGQWVEKGALLCELDLGSRPARLAQAEAALAQAEFDLKAKQTLQKKGFAPKTQIQALTAQRDAALAQSKEAKLELARTKITAPFDGYILGPLAEMGDQLKVGDACATVMNPTPMLVVGQISERDIGLVKEGIDAKIELVTGEKAKGKVRYVATASDVETRTFRVEVEVEAQKSPLRDGVTAAAYLELPLAKAHQMSPAHLTLSDAGTVGVMTVKEGKAKFIPVAILANENDGVWLNGLDDEVTVITVGQEFVKSGQPVEPVDSSIYMAELKAAKKSDEAKE